MATEFKDWVNLATTTKSTLVGSEKVVLTDGDSTKTATPEVIKNYVVSQGGATGQALFAATTPADAKAAIDVEPGVDVQPFSAALTQLDAAVVATQTAGTPDPDTGDPTIKPGPIKVFPDGTVGVGDEATSSGVTDSSLQAAINSLRNELLQKITPIQVLYDLFLTLDDGTILYNDFLTAGTIIAPIRTNTFGTGVPAIGNGTATPRHTGIIKLRGGTAAASGLSLGTRADQRVIEGGELFFVTFMPSTLADMFFSLQFGNSDSASAPTEGAVMSFTTAGVPVIKQYVAGVATTETVSFTGFTFTALENAKWYTASMAVSRNRSHIICSIYDATNSLARLNRLQRRYLLWEQAFPCKITNEPVGAIFTFYSDVNDATTFRMSIDEIGINFRNG